MTENMYLRKFLVGMIFYFIFLLFILFSSFILGWEVVELVTAVTNIHFLFAFFVYAPFWSLISEGLSDALRKKGRIKSKNVRNVSLLFHLVVGPLFLFFFPLLENNLEGLFTRFYPTILFLFLSSIPAFFYWCIEESLMRYRLDSKA